MGQSVMAMLMTEQLYVFDCGLYLDWKLAQNEFKFNGR